MATPKVRLNVEMNLETELVITKLANEANTSKSGIVKKSIYMMKNLSDAKKAGSKVMIIEKNGQQTELSEV